MNELISNPNFTPSEYKTLYPLFLFDVSKQSEKLKYSTTDIQIKMEFNENVPAGTEAFAVTISDRLIKFQSSKGVKKSVVKKSIAHEDYKKCLFTGKEQLRKMNVIRSHMHEVYTEEVNKKALCPCNDKRYILEDGVHTLALGHYRI